MDIPTEEVSDLIEIIACIEDTWWLGCRWCSHLFTTSKGHELQTADEVTSHYIEAHNPVGDDNGHTVWITPRAR